ncbi:MAG: BatD family protein [Chloroflexi bacterium]|nr:BatD family protein [Chloroflexota bacterium]
MSALLKYIKFRIPAVLLALLLVFCGVLYAADLSVSAQVAHDEVGMGQEINLQVAVEGTITGGITPELPTLSDFRVYQSGTSQNISFVNGAMSASFVFNYTLVPLRPGGFTIGAITVRHGGKEYLTAPIKITVVQGAQAPIPSSPAPPGSVNPPVNPPSPGSSAAGSIKSLFVAAEVDKKKTYVDQQITYTFRFYRSVNLVSRPQYQAPSFTGFFTEDLVPERPYSTTVEGRNVVVEEIKVALFPTAPGKYTIEPALLRCQIQDFANTDPWSDNFFEDFFSGGKSRELSTQPITIEVMPLPEGKPENFSGAVGKYMISAAVDKNSTEVNSPVTLTLSISGQGNLKTIGCPKLPGMPDFKMYEPVGSLNLSKEGGIIQGAQNFSIVLVPLKEGRLEIPSIEFNYFDPGTQQYNVERTNPIQLDVAPGKAGSTPPSAAPGTGTAAGTGTQAGETPVTEKDIRYIHTQVSGSRYLPVYKSPLYIVLLLLPFAVFFIVSIFNILRMMNKRDADRVRRSRAFRTAKGKLSGLPVSGKDACVILPDIMKIINEYFDNKFHMACSGMSFEQIRTFLNSHGADGETCSEFKEVFESTECAKFAPSQLKQVSAAEWKNKAVKLLERLERELK